MKKYKVEITKEKVVIKPLPGSEIDELLLDKINKHYERDGIFKPIKKELPKTWEEYISHNDIYLTEHLSVSEKYSNSFVALHRLIELRDHYNATEIESDSYSIYKVGNGFASTNNTINRGPIVLNSTKLGIEFVENFRSLIIKALPLL